MVIDSSAIVAVLLSEKNAAQIAQAIELPRSACCRRQTCWRPRS